MEVLWENLYHIFGKIYVPKILNNSKALIHISDTPSYIYSSIIKMVKKIKPSIVIHTGDIADDVKLELNPYLVNIYKKEADNFLNALSKFADLIVIVPGNHDNISVLDLKSNVKVIREGDIFLYEGLKLGLAHKFENLPKNCDFYLYGHDKRIFDLTYLNGIYYINIFYKNNVIKLYYPIGTDSYRFKISKIGK
ncbi:Calcineurin-like phosphoesterase [Caloramator fervidus]|uniref:Calcineurin-like phosphoesterase n=1 Tax=Caloramator fervidus TaxID=29344 RepID=A0A1H5W4R8_9CLOT|nr:metallophosphoesterase [Caloramator fervidus]SEF94485.1 Calcineurin-like phosphoesterase [Caloramator fervidus]